MARKLRVGFVGLGRKGTLALKPFRLQFVSSGNQTWPFRRALKGSASRRVRHQRDLIQQVVGRRISYHGQVGEGFELC
jgi:hypothetical protein